MADKPKHALKSYFKLAETALPAKQAQVTKDLEDALAACYVGEFLKFWEDDIIRDSAPMVVSFTLGEHLPPITKLR